MSIIIPETKLETIVCIPKPNPTDKAPANIAKLDKSSPVEDKAIKLQ